MTAGPPIRQELERQSVVPMECTIPAEMTVEEWRGLRSARARAGKRRPGRVLGVARRVVPLRPAPCDHLGDTTSRYDRAKKVLTFLLVCPICRTEKVVDRRPYEPRFEPRPTAGSVHGLTARSEPQPTSRAA
jgi:hypothetical protein